MSPCYELFLFYLSWVPLIVSLKLLYFEWSPPWHLCNLHNILCLKYANTHRSKASSTFCLLHGVFGETATSMVHLISPWHPIWNIFWHSSLKSTWHFIWHTFWHSISHKFWHSIWHSIWHIFWHSIWHSMWHSFWHSIWYSFWHSIWHSIWHIFWHLSSGPAVPTGLEKSPVEVQQYIGRWLLRSSGAHWDQQCPLRSGAGEEARRRGEGEGGGGRRGELSLNLTTLTWQVGNKIPVELVHCSCECLGIVIIGWYKLRGSHVVWWASICFEHCSSEGGLKMRELQNPMGFSRFPKIDL